MELMDNWWDRKEIFFCGTGDRAQDFDQKWQVLCHFTLPL